MKKYAIIAAAIVIGIVVGFGVTRMGEAKALNVNDIGADPSAFTGTITVTGIMAGVSQMDPSIIGIMDIKELQCTSANCNKIFIPIKVTGQKPAVGDEIRVTGQFQKLSGGFLFAAEKIKVVRNHKIGG